MPVYVQNFGGMNESYAMHRSVVNSNLGPVATLGVKARGMP